MDAPASISATAPARARPLLLRGLVFMVSLCTAIALLLAAIDRGGLGVKLVYSFAIGTCCWLLTDALRRLVGAVVERSRRRRGVTMPGPALGWRATLPLALMAMAVGSPLGMTIGDWLTGGRTASLLQIDSPSTRLTLALSAIATLTSVFVITILERLARARGQAERAQREAAEAQLRLLQSQLEPHMLFNTLANLRVLIGIDPAAAQNMLDHLNAFLRATLSASRASQHPLADEFARLADYLALMAVRMGPRLQVRLDLPAELAAQPVPPLLLQPLVENGIRHGLEPQLAGGRIEVAARREGDTLRLTVRDTGAGMQAAATTPGGGFGLTQVRERLATLYGARAALQLAPAADGGTLATIRLPIA